MGSSTCRALGRSALAAGAAPLGPSATATGTASPERSGRVPQRTEGTGFHCRSRLCSQLRSRRRTRDLAPSVPNVFISLRTAIWNQFLSLLPHPADAGVKEFFCRAGEAARIAVRLFLSPLASRPLSQGSPPEGLVWPVQAKNNPAFPPFQTFPNF